MSVRGKPLLLPLLAIVALLFSSVASMAALGSFEAYVSSWDKTASGKALDVFVTSDGYVYVCNGTNVYYYTPDGEFYNATLSGVSGTAVKDCDMHMASDGLYVAVGEGSGDTTFFLFKCTGSGDEFSCTQSFNDTSFSPDKVVLLKSDLVVAANGTGVRVYYSGGDNNTAFTFGLSGSPNATDLQAVLYDNGNYLAIVAKSDNGSTETRWSVGSYMPGGKYAFTDNYTLDNAKDVYLFTDGSDAYVIFDNGTDWYWQKLVDTDSPHLLPGMDEGDKILRFLGYNNGRIYALVEESVYVGVISWSSDFSSSEVHFLGEEGDAVCSSVKNGVIVGQGGETLLATNNGTNVCLAYFSSGNLVWKKVPVEELNGTVLNCSYAADAYYCVAADNSNTYVDKFTNSPLYKLTVSIGDPLVWPSDPDLDLAYDQFSIRVDYVVSNNGTPDVDTPSPETQLTFYLANDTIGSLSDLDNATKINKIELGSVAIPSLDPNANATGYTVLNVSREQVVSLNSDKVYLIAVASEAFDNDTSLNVTGADLTVTSVGVSPTELAPGDNFTVNATVANNGTSVAPTFVVSFYLCNGTVGDNSVLLGNATVPMLSGNNNTESVSLNVQMPSADELKGIDYLNSLYICAVADAAGQVYETKEKNNEGNSANKLSLKLPDLVVSSVAVDNATKTDLHPGDSVNMTFVISNIGNVTASNVEWKVYVTVDGNNETIGSGVYNGTIDANANATIATTVVLPQVVDMTGNVTLNVMVDPADKILELHENNNVNATAQVEPASGPDLVVSQVTATSTTVNPGDSVKLGILFKNQGNQNVGGFISYQVFLSSDNQLSEDDQPLYSDILSNGINRGETATVTTGFVQIPADVTGGTYYILVKVDSSDTVEELSEDNNVGALEITVPVQPVEPPAHREVGPANPATAPVKVSAGKLNAGFNYTANVDVLVGVADCDFTQIYWLNFSNCQFGTDFAYSSQQASVSCSDVQMPVDSGYVFWLVSPVDLGQLDFANGAYELRFYQFGTCE